MTNHYTDNYQNEAAKIEAESFANQLNNISKFKGVNAGKFTIARNACVKKFKAIDTLPDGAGYRLPSGKAVVLIGDKFICYIEETVVNTKNPLHCSVDGCVNNRELYQRKCLTHLLHERVMTDKDHIDRIQRLELIIKGLESDLNGIDDRIAGEKERMMKAYLAGSTLRNGESIHSSFEHWYRTQGES